MNPTQVWLAIALVLLLVELEVPIPTFFVAGALGVGAAIAAVVALVVPWTWAQVGLWLAASAGLTLWSRRFVPKDSPKLRDAEEAIVTLEIPAGGSGRVQYEGGSWRARCADPNLAIVPPQKVYVMERQGTTLVVMPAAADPWAEAG
ncbi:MAG: NfeD family protein [Oscillatoriales cyanobacterium SM2_1_8]|nr:NfeD family protein [Oscillatoriales cyanobacterium SM2_1_8]